MSTTQIEAQVSIRTITPEEAVNLLGNKSELQRKVRDGHVQRLTNEMNKGQFRLGCDAVVLVKGKLANGQHRLTALVESGKPQQFLVLETDDEELYHVIDCGASRTMADVVRLESYQRNIPAAVKYVLHYDRGGIHASGFHQNKNNPVTRSDIYDFIEKNKEDLIEDCRFVFSLYTTNARVLSVSQGTAFLQIAGRKESEVELSRAFIKSCYTGENQDAGRDYRERMMRDAMGRAKVDARYSFGLLLKAYNSYRKGTRPGNLFINVKGGEAFPQI